MSHWIRSLFGRSLALLQIALLLSAGCSGGPLTPTPGSAEHQAPGMIRVPGGVVNAAGGNLLVERTDLTLDGIVGGTLAVGAVYNSSLAGWTWSFGDPLRRRDASPMPRAALRHDGASRTAPRSRAATGSRSTPIRCRPRAGSPTTSTRRAGSPSCAGRRSTIRASATRGARRRSRSRSARGDGLRRLLSDRPRRERAPAERHRRAAAAGAPSSRGTPPAISRSRRARSRSRRAGRAPATSTRLLGLLTAITNSEGERIEYAYQSGRPHPQRDADRRRQSDPPFRVLLRPSSDGLYETLYTNPLGARTRLYFDREYAARGARVRRRPGSGARSPGRGCGPRRVTLENGATTDVHLRRRRPGDDPDAAGQRRADHLRAGRAEPGEPARASGPRASRTRSAWSRSARSTRSGRVVAVAQRRGRERRARRTTRPRCSHSITQPTGATLTFPLYGAHGHWLDMDGAVVRQAQLRHDREPEGRVGEGAPRRRAEPVVRSRTARS